MSAKFFYKNIDLVYFVNNKLINNNLINPKERMLLSFSGGQDSICFVFILNQLYSQLELDITFFWCHHLWQTDSLYLMQQIAKLSFLLQFNSCFPIPLNSISSELLARKWRQRCSYRVSLFYNYSKICLAHTFNDKVENIFLNFIRGTGLIGLTPLRWTQFISKSNITNKKYISRHNYLNNFCGTNLTNRRFVPFVVRSKVALFSNSMNFGGIPQLRVRRKPFVAYGTVIGAARSSLPLIPFTLTGYQGKGYGVTRRSLLSFTESGASLKSNGPNMCILESNSDKLKKLTKKVIRKFIQRDFALPQLQRNVLYKSYKSKICTICTICMICNSWQVKKGLQQFLFQQGTQKITNLTSINARFIRRFVQIGKPLPQKGMFCFPMKARPLPLYPERAFYKRAAEGMVSTGVTNEYKAKSYRVFTFQPTFNSSMIHSCRTNYFTEQRRSMRYPVRSKRVCNWYKFSIYNICTTSPKHRKQLLNCGKGYYIVRPLLSISRIELNKICYFWKLPIYPDKSNQKVKFFRNRVRGQLLPIIKLFFNLNIENIFLQLGKIIETEDYCLTQIVNEFIKNTDVYQTKLDIDSKKK